MKELDEEIQRLDNRIAGPIEGRIRMASEAVGAAQADRNTARRELRAAVEKKRRAYLGFSGDDYLALQQLTAGEDIATAAAAVRRFRVELFHMQPADRRGDLAQMRNRCRNEVEAAEERITENARYAVRDLDTYCSDWQIDNPLGKGNDLVEGYAWVKKEIAHLENNDLLKYREEAREAERQMQDTFKEQLLTKLAEKFKGVDHQLGRLNRTLAGFEFRSETYAFRRHVNDKFKNLYRLAMKVAESPEQGQAIIAGEAADHEAAMVREAMAELEQLIEGNADVSELEDYRRYFEYDLSIKKANGLTSSMRERTLKGSGGEAQLPFYIAIAASLSLSYFPGSQGLVNEGMGLVVFDEAFNKMDVPTTRKLFQFFKELGLQLLVASAEGQVANFSEVVDTIVMVTRSADQRSVHIDSEILGDRARREMAAANPDHLGIEGFRQQMAGGAMVPSVAGGSSDRAAAE